MSFNDVQMHVVRKPSALIQCGDSLTGSSCTLYLVRRMLLCQEPLDIGTNVLGTHVPVTIQGVLCFGLPRVLHLL